MIDPIDHSYQTVDVNQVAPAIEKFHDQVCSQHRRVEITSPGSKDVCVMVSKRELEHLERAVDMFADTPAFQEMCQNLQDLLAVAGVAYDDSHDRYAIRA